MKKIVTQKHCLVCFLFIFIGCLLFGGCKQYGPTLPLDSLDETFSEELRRIIYGLYERDPEDVLRSIRQLKQMKGNASPAVPYLASMLTDRRIAKERVYGYTKPVPLFKETAITLGTIGEKGIFALVDSLKGASHNDGFDDDFTREAVAVGLKAAKKQSGVQPFKKMCGTIRVLHIMDAVTECLALQSEPGLFDKTDPRKNLKFYKHFSAVTSREGLEIFIETIGDIGDERALSLLAEIVPLSISPKKSVKVDRFCKFQRASSIAQYKLRPLTVDEINPVIAEVLFLNFITDGDIFRVGKMLDEGMAPDTKTITGEPAISLAFTKKHIDVFNRLVQSGASIDYRLSKNDTLLIRAAAGGNYDFVKLLLENGADPSLINNAKEIAVVACFNELLGFWDRKSTNKQAEPYLKIIRLLKNTDSPSLPKKLLKSLDKKALKLLEL